MEPGSSTGEGGVGERIWRDEYRNGNVGILGGGGGEGRKGKYRGRKTRNEEDD
jgi:hypothetical protein